MTSKFETPHHLRRRIGIDRSRRLRLCLDLGARDQGMGRVHPGHLFSPTSSRGKNINLHVQGSFLPSASQMSLDYFTDLFSDIQPFRSDVNLSWALPSAMLSELMFSTTRKDGIPTFAQKLGSSRTSAIRDFLRCRYDECAVDPRML